MYVYSLDYVLQDLYNMIFGEKVLPWSAKKYEKRLRRFYYYLLLLELDNNNIEDTKSNITYIKTNVVDIMSDLKNINTTNDITDDTIKNIRHYITNIQMVSYTFQKNYSYLYYITIPLITFLITLMHIVYIVKYRNATIYGKIHDFDVNESNLIGDDLNNNASMDLCKKINANIINVNSFIKPKSYININNGIGYYNRLINGFTNFKIDIKKQLDIILNVINQLK
jgi:hypothetical protein